MTSPRDEALTLLRRAREELEGVSAFINSGVGTRRHTMTPEETADEQLDVWARVQQATNAVEKLMSELSTLASYEFAAAADSRKVSARMAADRSVRAAGRGYVGPSEVRAAGLYRSVPEGERIQDVINRAQARQTDAVTTPEENDR